MEQDHINGYAQNNIFLIHKISFFRFSGCRFVVVVRTILESIGVKKNIFILVFVFVVGTFGKSPNYNYKTTRNFSK